MTASAFDKISSEEVQRYIQEHEHADEKSLVLKHKELFGLPTSIIADQIYGRRKAKEKLRFLYNTIGIIYPKALNLAQSSSEATALFKAKIARELTGMEKDSCVDLTGGFGVDSFFLSTLFKHAHYVEPNEELLNVAKHNHNRLGATSVSYHNATAEDFLAVTKKNYDLIFIDPSRRDDSRKKLVKLSDCEPNVSVLLPVIFKHTKHILIKASPLVDLVHGLAELTSVSKIYVVSVDNECKEVLFLCSSAFPAEPQIVTINIHGETKDVFSVSRSEETDARAAFGGPLRYLYEPNASILKAGAFKLIGANFKLNKIHPNTHLYTSDMLRVDFPGRIFEVERTIAPNAKIAHHFFPARKANVITRNYPLTAEGLKKKLGLNDGEDKFVIAFSGEKKKYVVIASRVK